MRVGQVFACDEPTRKLAKIWLLSFYISPRFSSISFIWNEQDTLIFPAKRNQARFYQLNLSKNKDFLGILEGSKKSAGRKAPEMDGVINERLFQEVDADSNALHSTWLLSVVVVIVIVYVDNHRRRWSQGTVEERENFCKSCWALQSPN